MVPAASQSREAEPSAGRELSEPGTIHKAPGGTGEQGAGLAGEALPPAGPSPGLAPGPCVPLPLILFLSLTLPSHLLPPEEARVINCWIYLPNRVSYS